jgi:hypothetical protein
MNPIIYVILAIILVVILYYVYVYSTFTPILAKTVDLTADPDSLTRIESSNPNFTTSGNKNIQNMKYTYSVWIFIDNLSDIGNDQTLLSFLPAISTDTNSSYFKLYLDSGDTANLSVNIKCKNNIKSIIISPNFPLQRWTNVIVSVDTTFVDIYQDGKLVLSSAINKEGDAYGQIVKPDINSGILFGSLNNKQEVTLGNIMRWPYPIDPATAYNVYLQGNGQPSNGGVSLNLWSKTEDNGIKNKLFG